MPIRDLLSSSDRTRTNQLALENLSAASATPSEYTSCVTYTGKQPGYGLGVGFQPDLIWLKRLGSTTAFRSFDSVNGLNLSYEFQSAQSWSSTTTNFTSFHPNGYNLASGVSVNGSNEGYLTLNWIASPASGLDIVSYSGTGARQEIAHDLGTIPAFVVFKRRNGSTNTVVYSSFLDTPASQFLSVGNSNLPATDLTYWNNESFDSTKLVVGGTNTAVNISGGTYNAYIFSERAGISSFGRYTGNGSTTGPVITTGFFPQLVIAKRITGAVGAWQVMTRVRGAQSNVSLNSTLAESTASPGLISYQSDGFQLTSTSATINAASTDYIYMAWA